MYLGKIVEMGETGALFAAPQHPYTRRCSRRFRCPIPTRRAADRARSGVVQPRRRRLREIGGTLRGDLALVRLDAEWLGLRLGLDSTCLRRPPHVVLDLSVADVDGAVRVGGDVGFVGDEHDRVAGLVQPLEDAP